MRRTGVPHGREVMVALMGPTGTGKSSFIKLLTNDDNIRIGHKLESQTFDVSTSRYVDEESGLQVTLVDTPGFDDSRDGVTDVDILEKIVDFVQDKERTLHGIIYLNRISDPRLGSTAKKNLRVLQELCGEGLRNVRIVTTHWNLVDKVEGEDREAELRDGAFKPLIDAKAILYRHDKGLASARSIVSELIHQPPVMMKILTELNAGRALGDTSAGALIMEEMKELEKKHRKEMEELKKEMEEAARANDDASLRFELAEELRKLEEIMANAELDRKRLATTLRRAEERYEVDRDQLDHTENQEEWRRVSFHEFVHTEGCLIVLGVIIAAAIVLGVTVGFARAA